jgi:hypothetical protein
MNLRKRPPSQPTPSLSTTKYADFNPHNLSIRGSVNMPYPTTTGRSKPDMNTLYPDVEDITILIIVVLIVIICVLGAYLAVLSWCDGSRREDESQLSGGEIS